MNVDCNILYDFSEFQKIFRRNVGSGKCHKQNIDYSGWSEFGAQPRVGLRQEGRRVPTVRCSERLGLCLLCSLLSSYWQMVAVLEMPLTVSVDWRNSTFRCPLGLGVNVFRISACMGIELFDGTGMRWAVKVQMLRMRTAQFHTHCVPWSRASMFPDFPVNQEPELWSPDRILEPSLYKDRILTSL